MACMLNEDECIRKIAGTVGFMAPEVALEQPSEYKADVWSLGAILYLIVILDFKIANFELKQKV